MRIAETSNSSLTFSETRTPPVSSAAFQVRPQSLRLMVGATLEADAEVAERVVRGAGLLEDDGDRLGDVLDGQVAGDRPLVAVALDVGGGEGDLREVLGVEEVAGLEVAVAVGDAGLDAGDVDGQVDLGVGRVRGVDGRAALEAW